ncbi:MAG: 4-hydroxythreonine-4-phosphate dehydrogenase PdxA [Candidatus Omnitrophota bacterium]
MSLEPNPISRSIKVGITLGDPSGIGPAITLKALDRLKGLADFTVIGDSWVLNKARGARCAVRGINLIDLHNINRKKFAFGKIKAEYGRASIEYLDKALELLRDQEIDCLVTAPISKEAINLAGCKYSGHTEYLLKRTRASEAVMMLLNDKLRFSLVTRHIPLNRVSRAITAGGLCNNMLITCASLRRFFGIKKPRLVVCGLNPHASDNGIIGNEEKSLLEPAIEKVMRKERVEVDGPLSSDIAVLRASRGQYDCVIAMYHDQALIPLKLTGTDTGVNLTLGLPFIRTSPLHGTGFDIAETPRKASPASMIAAVRTAVKCASNLKRA